MKMVTGRFAIPELAVFWLLLNAVCCRAIEPQTLFNFEVGPGTATASLVQGPDGNFYGTTAQGGPMRSGTVFRVTPAGVLTTLVSDQADPAAGLEDPAEDAESDPLTEAERQDVLEDLSDLEIYQALLSPTGIRGLVIECEDCHEPHYFD